MEGNFVYSKKDVLVAGVAVTIIVTLLGVGFGVTSGASIQTVVESSELGPDHLESKILNILDKKI